ncbi:MAG: SUMF1/EgtB/PvdO family nonheme iron enzyme [Blastocatellia bacterium]|nr:SUMF1/EgtB/PvdO family nonheme iron enzyme [Blastocatellia bacterium]
MSQDLPPSIPSSNTPPSQRPQTVFISYSHEDKAFADRLKEDLTRAEHPCWIDTSAIRGGEEWISAIATGILDSYAVVVIVTHNALRSRYVRDEILWARTNDKLIIPLILNDVFKEKAFFPLIGYQGVSMLDGNYDGALPRLLQALPTPASLAPIAVSLDDSRKREIDYLERLRFEELLNAEKYTPLGGASQQKRAEMRAVFELMRFGKGRDEVRETKRFENAVEEIRRLRRAVLLGEPGGGKTTTIWKLAAGLVADALDDRQAPIPLLVRLGRWTDADQPLDAFIASQLGDLGGSLETLLAEKRAALLLDGLNELPTGQRDAKYPQVKRLIEQHTALMAIVSCRELDYTVDLGFDRINITPLDPLRIREFAVRYLEEEKGEALFWKLARKEARDFHTEFLTKVGPDHEPIFWLADHLPEGLKWTYDWDTENKYSRWGDWLRVREEPSSLMVLARNPYMLLMLTSVFAEQNELPENRGELFRLFVETLLKRERIPEDEQAPLTDGLAAVAYEMQIRRADSKEGDALTVLPRAEVAAMLNERLLYLAGSASILSVGEQVRFTHQLLQEYFAARYMDQEIRAERLNAAQLWPPNRWRERTNWEEAAILLAGLYSDDCSHIVEWLADAQPEIALMCATRSGAAPLPEATAERLRAKWIPRLADLSRDRNPKARAAIGCAVGTIGGDSRKGVGIIRNSRGIALPDIDWVEIPGGEFQYGDNPPEKLTLPTFHIARYPVTYAQYQTFLDDPAGFADARWFEGLAAKDEDRPPGEQRFKFANHPRERVNWYGAIAFCRWLSWRLGGGYDLKKVDDWAVRLPTEFEWEKAAHGTDGRIYPYEGEFDSAKGNTLETHIGQTSAVGIFPNGASPYGVMDMSGNVWEWCLNNYEKPAQEARNENLRTDKNRILRGGSFVNHFVLARAVYRIHDRAAINYYGYGFRLFCVLRPPSP